MGDGSGGSVYVSARARANFVFINCAFHFDEITRTKFLNFVVEALMWGMSHAM